MPRSYDREDVINALRADAFDASITGSPNGSRPAHDVLATMQGSRNGMELQSLRRVLRNAAPVRFYL